MLPPGSTSVSSINNLHNTTTSFRFSTHQPIPTHTQSTCVSSRSPFPSSWVSSSRPRPSLPTPSPSLLASSTLLLPSTASRARSYVYFHPLAPLPSTALIPSSIIGIHLKAMQLTYRLSRATSSSRTPPTKRMSPVVSPSSPSSSRKLSVSSLTTAPTLTPLPLTRAVSSTACSVDLARVFWAVSA